MNRERYILTKGVEGGRDSGSTFTVLSGVWQRLPVRSQSDFAPMGVYPDCIGFNIVPLSSSMSTT